LDDGREVESGISRVKSLLSHLPILTFLALDVVFDESLEQCFMASVGLAPLFKIDFKDNLDHG
jgi:hypothetical protein